MLQYLTDCSATNSDRNMRYATYYASI